MSLDVKAYAVTDVGRRRKRNEDTYVVAPQIGLFAVADGMGGQNAGNVASQRAVAVVQAALQANGAELAAFRDDPSPARGAAAARVVEQAIQRACADIYAAGASDPALRGMGTTFVSLVVAGERGIVAHVGDSRLYLHRAGAVHVLTEDHTLIAEQIKAGELLPENVPNSPFKGVLTRALGQHESVQVDTLVVDLYPGDAFLLCSDGLHGYLTDAELQQRLAEGASQALAEGLVATANERGGRDNITALLVAAGDAAPSSRGDVPRIDVLRRIPLFEHLSYRELSEVLAIASTRGYAVNELVVRQGDPGGDLFVLLQGEVTVEQGGLPIAVVRAGGHFGEMGLVDAGPRSASVRAREPLRAMVVHRDAMMALMQREPAIAVKLLWVFVQALSQRLRATNTELSDALGGPETTRF
jgi:serine/threonine protein phosphatase PrpC